MREVSIRLVFRVALWTIFVVLLFALISCSKSGSYGDLIYTYDEISSYPDVIAKVLPDHTLIKDQTNSSIFSYLNEGHEAETFDVLAVGALENSIAGNWYPQYLATVVIAVDRNLTKSEIGGWMDLLEVRDAVAISTDQPDQQLLMSAISFGLEGENFSLDSAAKLLRAFRQEKRLELNTFSAPLIICFDYQATALIRSGRQLEIIVPVEGSLTYEKGIISSRELSFRGDEESALLEAGFRLRDGSYDVSSYPGADYENASQLEDYGNLSRVSQDATRIFRRNVMRTHLYSSADTREHQLFPYIYIVIVVIWLASIIGRTLQKRVKDIFHLTAVVLLGWIIVRLIKYQLPASALNRYFWYVFYIFQLSLPILLLWLVWRSDRTDDQPASNRILTILTLFNGVLIAFVLTNDLHNLVFQLDLSNPRYSNDYTYGPVFYLITITWITELISAFIMLLIKSIQLPRKTALVFPLAFCVILLIYAIGYITRVPIFWFSDYTMVVGLLSLFFLEASLQTGLVQGNSKYSSLFAHSPLKMQIINTEGQLILTSANAPKFDPGLQQAALAAYPSAVKDSKDTLVFSTKITGGYAQWQEDISSLNSLQQAIRVSVRKLKLTNDILERREEIHRELDEEDAKIKLMSQLEEIIASDLVRLSSMIEELDNTAGKSSESGRVALLLCFIKRRSNLFFRGQETESLSVDELNIYIDELAEIAQYAGVNMLVSSDVKKIVPVRSAVLLYEFAYTVIDWAARVENSHVLLHFLTEKEQIKLRILPSEDPRTFEPGEKLRTAIASADGEFACKDLDGAVGISLSFPWGGEQNG
ncbi:MAG TPA: hypothetical protein GXZ59_03765 [Clostridiaceae bacterium]|nr:hypothetical protein [Clostridiaceae bacterium]